jgi:hypothetical protein
MVESEGKRRQKKMERRERLKAKNAMKERINEEKKDDLTSSKQEERGIPIRHPFSTAMNDLKGKRWAHLEEEEVESVYMKERKGNRNQVNPKEGWHTSWEWEKLKRQVNLPFTGSEDAYIWIEEIRAKTWKMEKTLRLEIAIENLKGKAKQCWESISTDLRITWREFTKEFEIRWINNELADFLSQMKELKVKEGDINNFCDEFLRLYKRIGMEISDRTALGILTRALQDVDLSLAHKVRYDCNDVREAIKYARTFSRMIPSKGKHRKRFETFLESMESPPPPIYSSHIHPSQRASPESLLPTKNQTPKHYALSHDATRVKIRQWTEEER